MHKWMDELSKPVSEMYFFYIKHMYFSTRVYTQHSFLIDTSEERLFDVQIFCTAELFYFIDF